MVSIKYPPYPRRKGRRRRRRRRGGGGREEVEEGRRRGGREGGGGGCNGKKGRRGGEMDALGSKVYPLYGSVHLTFKAWSWWDDHYRFNYASTNYWQIHYARDSFVKKKAGCVQIPTPFI